MPNIAAYPCRQISFEKKDLTELVTWMSELKDEPYQTNLGMCTSLKEKRLVEKEDLSKEEWIQEIASLAKYAKKFLDTHEPNTDFYSVAAVGYLRELIALC